MKKNLQNNFATILIVTASPFTRNFFEEAVLLLEHHTFIFAYSAIAAMECLSKSHVDCVIIDEKTPSIPLISFCKKIRTLKTYENLPILIITGQLKKSFASEMISAGANDFLREPLDKDEFFLRLQMMEERRRTEQKTIPLTYHLHRKEGEITPLNERILLDDRAAKMISEAIIEGHSISLVMLEIDQYESIARTEGGDIANTLYSSFHAHLEKLIRHQDLLFRQKEGKFIIVLPKTSGRAAFFIAENIEETLETELFSINEKEIKVTVSMGIANLEGGKKTEKSSPYNLNRLLDAAMLCLLEAKQTGNTIIFHSLQVRFS